MLLLLDRVYDALSAIRNDPEEAAYKSLACVGLAKYTDIRQLASLALPEGRAALVSEVSRSLTTDGRRELLESLQNAIIAYAPPSIIYGGERCVAALEVLQRALRRAVRRARARNFTVADLLGATSEWRKDLKVKSNSSGTALLSRSRRCRWSEQKHSDLVAARKLLEARASEVCMSSLLVELAPLHTDLTVCDLSRVLATESSVYHALRVDGHDVAEDPHRLVELAGISRDRSKLSVLKAPLLMTPSLPPMRRSQTVPKSLDSLALSNSHELDFSRLAADFESQRLQHRDAAATIQAARSALERPSLTCRSSRIVRRQRTW